LEAREIKRLLPRYNSVGRDDKASWFIRLDTNEPYPVPVRVAENAPEDGVVHIGPYRSASVLDTCMEALGRIFPLKRCPGDGGACFYGQMGRCAPCAGMGEEEYRREVVDEIVALLRGEGGEEHLHALVRERKRLAQALEFEAAARLRDLIAGIERVRLARSVVSGDGAQAVVAPSTEPGVIEVFVLSEGRLVSHRGFEAGDAGALTRFAGRRSSGSGPCRTPARRAPTRRGSWLPTSGAGPGSWRPCGWARPQTSSVRPRGSSRPWGSPRSRSTDSGSRAFGGFRVSAFGLGALRRCAEVITDALSGTDWWRLLVLGFAPHT
jgi:hypothetical protein